MEEREGLVFQGERGKEKEKEKEKGRERKKAPIDDDTNPDADGEYIEDCEGEAEETMLAQQGPPVNVIKYIKAHGLSALTTNLGVTYRRHSTYPNLILFKYSQVYYHFISFR